MVLTAEIVATVNVKAMLLLLLIDERWGGEEKSAILPSIPIEIEMCPGPRIDLFENLPNCFNVIIGCFVNID